MKRERDDDREGGVVVEKICRGDGPRGRGRARGGRGSTRRPPSRGLDYAGYDYSQGYEVPAVDPDEVELKADLEVRREMVGPVIGRQGQTVTQIRKDSGAQIHIRDSVPGEADQIIEIKGTRHQVEEAYQQIRQVLSTEDEDYGFHHPGIKSSLILVHIAPEMVGCLIGKAGKNVKLIKEETGANIRVDAQVDSQPFQTVNITGATQSVIEAYVRVSECLRSFDPKKSKMLRGIDDQSPISTVSIPQNPVYNSSANFGTGIVGVGGVVGTEQAQYMNPSQQQTFIIQAPMQPTPEVGSILSGGAPAVLVLQPDGTYQPAPVIYQPVQQNQSNPGFQYTSVSVAQDPLGGSGSITGLTMPQYQYAGAQPPSAQNQIVLPSGGTMIHSPVQGMVGTPTQNIVGIQPGGLTVSAGMSLAPQGVIGQQQ